ncbi:MAG: class II SORL domain-containing protein [Thermodesulfovibrionales bacterium]
MERRSFLKAAAVGTAVIGTARELFAAEKYFPSKADQALFENINRAKDPAKKTPLEKSHSPVITAPERVKAGEPFTVDIAVGENIHAMGPAHWIENIELSIGNEPAGRVDLQPKGYATPKVAFTLILQKDAAPSGKVTLVAHQRCNLHGYWESSLDLTVT